MNRHFFTTENKCTNKCVYCFEKFNTNKFPVISYAKIKDFNQCIIYPACDTELLHVEQLSQFFEDYLSKSNHFNVFSFSTKNDITLTDLSKITDLNNKIKENKLGEIKISISITNKYKIHELEQGTATYVERLTLAQKLTQNGIKTSVILKPILPFISINEYKEIINDFIEKGVLHFVTGNLYLQENTLFYNNYIKNKGYSITSKKINWIENTPTWLNINSISTIQELSIYIKSLNGFHYNSDKELVESYF